MDKITTLHTGYGLTPKLQTACNEFWEEVWKAIDKGVENGMTVSMLVGSLEVAKTAIVTNHINGE